MGDKRNKMQKTYKFRLYPTKNQEQVLIQSLEHCRYVYNTLLEWLNKQDNPDRYSLQNRLPMLKQEHPELNDVYSKALQYEVYRLFYNLRGLSQSKKNHRRVGGLRFKPSHRFRTIHYNQSGFKITTTEKRLDRLHLSKIGDLPMLMHRPVEGTVKQVVIKHYLSGKWYACIVAEQQTNVAKTPICSAVGIDVGLKHFCSDSDGLQVENPKYLNKSLKQLKRKQRNLSRTLKRSCNRNKQRTLVARKHECIQNQRNDFLHKLSHYYVNHYDLIAVEDLNIKNMVRNHHLARHIHDASWNQFAKLLFCMAESAGKTTVCVNPWGTSQEHNHGLDIDRDYNASLNILERGLQKVGLGLSELTLVDIRPLQRLHRASASRVVETGSPFLEHRTGSSPRNTNKNIKTIKQLVPIIQKS
jgi:putative transposase